MKKTITGSILLILVAFIYGPVFGQEDKEAAAARKELATAKRNLTAAKIDSAADYAAFKEKAISKIKENNKMISELRNAGPDLDKKLSKKYEKKVLSLQRKNDGLQKQIDGSVHTKTTQWTRFKSEFNQDMNELSDAIKNIGVNNH